MLVLRSRRQRTKTELPSGIMVGQGPRPGTAWVLTDDEHVLLVGSPGSGKSRRIILPTIGVIGMARRESMLINDPKGELYAYTADWLRSRGYRVVRIDLRQPSRGNRWNPVKAVADALAAGRWDAASALAWDIGHLFAWSSEYKGGDPIWPQSQEALIAALVLGVAQGKPPGPFADDPELAARIAAKVAKAPWPNADTMHMASVYQSLISGESGGRRIDEWMRLLPEGHPARSAFGPVSLSTDKTRSSILTGAGANLRLFGDGEVAWLTSAQDHDLADLGRRPTAVFLVIPDERGTRYPLATLYIQQTVQALTQLADNNGGRLPVRVNMLLDEFGNLPQLRDWDHTVTVCRGRGIRLLLALQDLAQLKRHYQEAAQTIKGSCRVWLYLLTADLDTAKEISGKLGEYTTFGETQSMPKVYWTSSTVPGHATNTQTLMKRPLLLPDELLRWPEGQALVLQARHAPARLTLPDLSAWDVFRQIQEPISQAPERAVRAPTVWRPGKELEPHPGAAAGTQLVDGRLRDPGGIPVEELGAGMTVPSKNVTAALAAGKLPADGDGTED